VKTVHQVKRARPVARADFSAAAVLAWLKRRGSRRNIEGMARYAIVAPKAFGVSVADLRLLGRQVGTNRELAVELWDSGWYEARMLTAFIDDPAQLTSREMDRRTREFDNWAICDALCFHLFDRTPHAWKKIDEWSRRRAEFERRAAFALLASVALHDKAAPDAAFTRGLRLIERAASDERNFVKKGVSWALRAIGERNARLHEQAMNVATCLAASPELPMRWIGKDARRQLQSPAVRRRVAAR
jgi:3-methyladenine DNA glycosylase AlkD